MRKLAILDTDFLSKGLAIQADEKNHLIHRVLDLSGYSFVCHEQTVLELSKHLPSVSAWLEVSIRNGIIIKYTDEQIISEMEKFYFHNSLLLYTSLLKNACEAMDKNYFTKHFGELNKIDYTKISNRTYLTVLKRLDQKIEAGNSLGEIKEYLLIQWLKIRGDTSIVYFCSDDKKARNGILALENPNVQCISIISCFLWLKENKVLSKQSAQPYIQSALLYFQKSNQTSIRVVEASSVGRYIRIPIRKIFELIFDGYFIKLPNGMLKYRIPKK